MSEQQQNNNNQYATNAQGGPEGATNKVSFSSIRGGVNSKGSPTMALHVGGKNLDLLIELLIACKNEPNSVGSKIMVQIIPGKEYDSGYCYVNPKQPREQNNGTGNSNFGATSANRGNYNRAPTQNDQARTQGQASAKSFFSNKKLS